MERTSGTASSNLMPRVMLVSWPISGVPGILNFRPDGHPAGPSPYVRRAGLSVSNYYFMYRGFISGAKTYLGGFSPHSATIYNYGSGQGKVQPSILVLGSLYASEGTRGPNRHQTVEEFHLGVSAMHPQGALWHGSSPVQRVASE